MSSDLSITNAHYLDVAAGIYRDGDIQVANGIITGIGKSQAPRTGPTYDAKGKFVLPGLIDCHVHLTAITADVSAMATWSPAYVAFGAAKVMGAMLDRGFTTVRDAAGADYGYHDAQASGMVRGPKVFFAGKALTQTGGHADSRQRGQDNHEHGYCRASIGRIADGVDAVRQAARDELRKGAHHIKIMAGGGVASPTDRIDSTQYSVGELRAAVEEAEAANRYVTAHAYTGRSINRALKAGVRGIEHGNLLDEESIELFNQYDAFLTMNLVTYWSLQEEGREFGLSQTNWEKVDSVLNGGLEALRRAYEGGVNLTFGTDLLGGMHRHQAKEFEIRAKIIPVIDVIRSATTTAAKLLQREGELGVIAPGAAGDFIITDQDPLDDVSILSESRLAAVIQDGRVVSLPD
ncbi:metal-dependent hydrolase family protein [Arthrobacter sp. MMS18-M83]|uniref:metal-dependent hydrolase family protein n=1 Tax=Arthrobacter sp. MMS18-M83 TaxID=2996261 RepID=UPI00227B710F|nr:amidohydrolase family protein [Arthrobacter sp. MMS18-M83]WAH97222.1 amidohydrolase family protein [Arthrobacter sp. MMS18-M83]